MNISLGEIRSFGFLAILLSLLIWYPFAVNLNLYWIGIAVQFLIYLLLVFSWGILARSGPISLGHAAFFGIGAYFSSLLSMNLGLTPYITVFIAALLATALFFPIALPLFRLRSDYFIIATMVIPMIVQEVFNNLESVGRDYGITKIPSFQGGPLTLYYFALSLSIITGLAVLWIRRRRWGLAFASIMEDEQAAESIGINVFNWRLLAFTVSIFVAAMAGGIYAHYFTFINPGTVFGLDFSFLPAIAVLFGGADLFAGHILGITVLFLTDELFFLPFFPELRDAFYGIMLIIIVIFVRGGIAQLRVRFPRYHKKSEVNSN